MDYYLQSDRGVYIIPSYTFNSKVIAGKIFSIVENKLYLHVIAHDNELNDFNIVNLILQDKIQFAFENNTYKFHFVWGECEYKR